MTLIKNKRTPEGREFWRGVEAASAAGKLNNNEDTTDMNVEEIENLRVDVNAKLKDMGIKIHVNFDFIVMLDLLISEITKRNTKSVGP